ncbi:4930_t:CDS:2 [Funneliformis mosseae]|uniref:4930_t:CDS:1 n=1 Tax=Funneliformis mosseae TaxID=27381 RepID=A0A9N9HUV0_FUNMO|nr:4930_t:CDS:2 [Funneliformis mosseae]
MTSSREEDEKQPKGASYATEISATEDYENVYFDNDPIPQSVKETNKEVDLQSDRVDDNSD